jgi:hypothetical protein
MVGRRIDGKVEMIGPVEFVGGFIRISEALLCIAIEAVLVARRTLRAARENVTFKLTNRTALSFSR